MQKRLRDLLRVLVADLRHTLSGGPNGQRGDLDRELERLGIAPDGTVTPFDALPNPTPAERRARRVAEAQLAAAPAAQLAATRAEVVERAAYTWINRLLALRAAEARGLINEILRSDPAYDGLSEALFILRQTQPQRAAGPDGGWWAVIEDACRAQAASLPGLFGLADPSAALRPSVPALLRCVAIVGNPPAGYTADEAEATFADPDAIGWAYQFYQEEAKARTYAKLNSGGKAATRAEIAAVTQLFTEPYMVKWLLQNSLGRTYHELYPDSKLPETWEYYIRDLPRDESVDNLASAIRELEDLTFMDPCMGSGHFEREAFDMHFAMYREQHPEMGATEIADRILTRHLHGIDLDPRAAQLAALTLYLRAWEMIRDERRAKRLPGPGSYRPPAMNLATTPSGLTPGSLERHLQRHPEDRIYRPLLEGIFAALEQADVLGSLLRPGEQLDAAVRGFRARPDGQMQLVSDDAGLNHLLAELAQHNPNELKRVLLEKVARSFAADSADTDDVGLALFGREAGEGVKLLELLSRRYMVVATNPPYAGSGSVPAALKLHLETHYSPGRRDLYSAFILRCKELAEDSGRVAMVTMHGWLFLNTFSDFRCSALRKPSQTESAGFQGILKSTTLEALAHLGAGAFPEIGGGVVQVAMFTLVNALPASDHVLTAFRLLLWPTAEEKELRIRRMIRDGESISVSQKALTEMPNSIVAYNLPAQLLRQMAGGHTTRVLAYPSWAVSSSDNSRFLRLWWEVEWPSRRWVKQPKGGTYRKWAGLDHWTVEWRDSGATIASFLLERYPYLGSNYEIKLRKYLAFLPGWTYSSMAGKGLGLRRLSSDQITNAKSPALYTPGQASFLGGILNSSVATFILRSLTPSTTNVDEGYVGAIPVPVDPGTAMGCVVDTAVELKTIVVQQDPTEHSFDINAAERSRLHVVALLHGVEGWISTEANRLYGLSSHDVAQITSELGTPVAWHSLVEGFDSLTFSAFDLGLPPVPQEIVSSLAAHKRVTLATPELTQIKAKLQALYETGPGAKDSERDEDEQTTDVGEGDGSNIEGMAHIPPETFLEELSQRLQIHPVSVYWLLEELRAEGVRCKPEELRLLDDRLSVLVLRLLGHRWPRQIEAGEPNPSWADPDGIIPLTAIAGEASLAERVRSRLRGEDGDRGAQQVEALLLEITGQTLDEWLRRNFFARHVRQFKHRPIAWHLASTPTKNGGRKKAKREPAFQCLLYYHACRGDVLARLRAHYVEPLIRLERAATAEARRRGDETAAAIAVSRVQELEEFAARLREVEESGFACTDLDRLLADEALDRWSGDGIVPCANADELAAQERAWRVDINDGVRVNIAPLQLAGLLTSDVLRPDDARKAIADRARWRSDERRWVREGVLPRCGWMDEDVPESPRWTERAPEREAEQRKLEEKRRAVIERLAGNADPSG